VSRRSVTQQRNSLRTSGQPVGVMT
jgi:hypothetical protein